MNYKYLTKLYKAQEINKNKISKENINEFKNILNLDIKNNDKKGIYFCNLYNFKKK